MFGKVHSLGHLQRIDAKGRRVFTRASERIDGSVHGGGETFGATHLAPKFVLSLGRPGCGWIAAGVAGCTGTHVPNQSTWDGTKKNYKSDMCQAIHCLDLLWPWLKAMCLLWPHKIMRVDCLPIWPRVVPGQRDGSRRCTCPLGGSDRDANSI
jgi:hypothetical protein